MTALFTVLPPNAHLLRFSNLSELQSGLSTKLNSRIPHVLDFLKLLSVNENESPRVLLLPQVLPVPCK